MASNGDPAFEVRVPSHEECIQTVYLQSHFLHNHLTVGGAVVEEDIQNCVVGKVPEAVNARQGYSLQISEKRKRCFKQKTSINSITSFMLMK